MVLAHGMNGAGMAFGLGFLNVVGHILFLFLILLVIRKLVYSWKYGDMNADFCGPSSKWKSRKEAWKTKHENETPTSKVDDAMAVARQRVAEGEIKPEDFEVIKQGLSNDHVHQDGWSARAHDAALDTARMRFAKGEINLKEFEAVKKTLMGA